MDFIYSRLNNNLVDINRLESITLLKCEQENIPLEGLHIGDYYLKFTVVDSDKISYCDLSQLNDDEKSAADALYEEQQRAIARENTIENNSGNYLDIEQEENTGIVTIKLLNIHGSVLDTKTLDLETEKIIRNVTLDQENKSLIFSLVDSTTITCDISDLINDYNVKINNLTTHTNEEINRLDLRLDDEITRANQSEQNITDKLSEEINRAQNAEQKLTKDLNQEISDRQDAVTSEKLRAEQVENTLKTNLENEIQRSTEKDDILNNNLNQEIQDRINSDNTITENINQEIERAKNKEEELYSKLTRYFDRFVNGENIDKQFIENEIVYCYDGNMVVGGDVPSTITLRFNQSSNKAIYIKNIYIKYINIESQEVEYNYSFESKIFTVNNETKELNGINWLLLDSNDVTYFGYNNSYGQQIGSSTLGIRDCILKTADFAGCTIKEIKVITCGSASTKCTLSITVGNDTWLYHEGRSDQTSIVNLQPNHISNSIDFTYGEGSILGTGTLKIYTNTFLTKKDSQIEIINPETEILYINKDDERIYLFNGETLIELSKVLELGLTSTTAYRGDFGNANYQNINNILNNKLTIKGEKTFAQTMIVGEDSSQNIKIGITKDNIYCIKSPGVYTTTLNSESGTIDSHNTTYDLTNSGIITNVTDPVNGRDVTHKNYVDNSLKSVSDTLSADISSEASRATGAESALQNAINSEIDSRTESDTNLSNRLNTVETLISTEGSNQTLAGLVFEEIKEI